MAIRGVNNYEQLMAIARRSMSEAESALERTDETVLLGLFDTAQKFIDFTREAPFVAKKTAAAHEFASLFDSSDKIIALAKHSEEAANIILEDLGEKAFDLFDTAEKLTALAKHAPMAAEHLMESGAEKAAALFDSAEKIIALAKKSPGAAFAAVWAANYAKNINKLFTSAKQVIKLAKKSPEAALGVVELGKESIAKLFDKYSILKLFPRSKKAACKVNRYHNIS